MINDIEKIKQYIRAANYLTVTQIYLRDNFLLKQPLEVKDIKPRLFGHWGTCPGINFVYAHLNYFVKQQKIPTMFVLGPGHGFPALQANLFLEETLAKYYSQVTLDEKGISYVSKMFSWPYGFSSHSNPEAPGLILEGGELGYSLATAYGAILDNPDLLAVCMIGDGEAETGPIASAWHISKLIDPAVHGAVLPILHVNGYKISGPTIFGRMSDTELTELFRGYGYEPIFVKASETIHEDMIDAMNLCLSSIKSLQYNARKKGIHKKPRFPMIILQTPKGWTGIKNLKEKLIEGTIHAHQVVAPNAKKDEVELAAIERWLASYQFEELFDSKKGFTKDVLDILPHEAYRIGDIKNVYAHRIYSPLKLPHNRILAKETVIPGKLASNSMKKAGEYLAEVFRLNKNEKNFRLFSPDETYSNRLDSVFSVTSRAFVWPHKKDDNDLSFDGRVMEMLSEHNLHGLAQGYILTGRHAAFTTYEAFAQIFSSMSHQYEKFLKVARTLPWRGSMASMNYLISSVLWRQEHNGFTHQNPSFISSMLEKHDCNIKVYFPVDEHAMIATLRECLSSQNSINTIVAGKTNEPQWQTMGEAEQSVTDGASIWKFASKEDPDVVFVGIGDYMTKEVMAAVEILNQLVPKIAVRVVNISKLSGRCHCKENHSQIPHPEYLMQDKPVIINFHGYPETIESMLLQLPNSHRFRVHGYQELGGTTTPFDMHVRNKTSRYHLVIEAVELLVEQSKISKEKAEKLIAHMQDLLTQHTEYVTTYGADPIEIEEWHWESTTKMIDAKQITVLETTKTIGIIGLSDDPDRYSYKVAHYLQSQGYKIIPVNPSVAEVLGEKAYPSLLDIPQHIKLDLVAIYRRSEDVFPHIKEVIKRNDAKTIWLPEGVRNKEAEQFAIDKGYTVVSDFCIMKVHQQFKSDAVIN